WLFHDGSLYVSDFLQIGQCLLHRFFIKSRAHFTQIPQGVAFTQCQLQCTKQRLPSAPSFCITYYHTLHCLPFLYFQPQRAASAGPIRTVSVLRHNSLKSHSHRSLEQLSTVSDRFTDPILCITPDRIL